MRKSIAALLMVSLLEGAAPADAATYKNYTALRKVYPYDVSESATAVKRAGTGILS